MSQAKARVLQPNRSQMELRPSDLESLLPEGHRARLVWADVERQNLDGLYAGIKAVEGGVGRAAIAPEILFALWRYATLEGVGTARAIARFRTAYGFGPRPARAASGGKNGCKAIWTRRGNGWKH